MFPRLVFKCPGPHQRAGGTYDHKAVENDKDMADALLAGWHATLPEAIDPPKPGEQKDTAPPTREELEQKAAELGIKVDGRWSDARLLSEIQKKV